jgi:hypothetical protein
MPGADDKKTKYTKDGAYELMQWKSAKGAKAADGSVTDKRNMEGGSAGVKAEGQQERRHLHRDLHAQAQRHARGRQGDTPIGVAIHS